jgi:uncharacterized protein
MDQIKFYTLITGASDGFGKALAIECARRKMNLVLVALPGPELSNLAGFIQKNFLVDVKTFEKDLTNEADCYDLHLDILFLDLHINILINNAGIGNTQMFTETSPEFLKRQIKLNVMATTLLTSLFVPELKKYGPAYLLNIGSLSSFFYLPKKQVYGATKSFIYFFSKCLRHELKRENISVSVACPGGMNTNFSVSLINRTANCVSRISILNPEKVAPIVIGKMLKRKAVIVPGKMNQFSMLLNKLLPSFIKNIVTAKLMNDLKSLPLPSVTIQKNPSYRAA